MSYTDFLKSKVVVAPKSGFELAQSELNPALKEDYTRAQWQIDAHGYWRSSGDRLIGKAELMSAPTDRLQKLYREYSRDTVYSYEDHVELARKLDAEGRLPASTGYR